MKYNDYIQQYDDLFNAVYKRIIDIITDDDGRNIIYFNIFGGKNVSHPYIIHVDKDGVIQSKGATYIHVNDMGILTVALSNNKILNVKTDVSMEELLSILHYIETTEK